MSLCEILKHEPQEQDELIEKLIKEKEEEREYETRLLIQGYSKQQQEEILERLEKEERIEGILQGLLGTLHKEQRYIIGHYQQPGQELSIETIARLQHHIKPTRTTKQKAEELGISQSRVIKALYLQKSPDDKYVAIIAPGDAELDTRTIISEALGISRKQAKRYRVLTTPEGMSYGTCTPFPKTSVLDRQIKAMIYLTPQYSEERVDVSLGDELKHRTPTQTSLILPVKDLRTIIAYAGYEHLIR